MFTPTYFRSECIYTLDKIKSRKNNNFDRHYFEKKGIPIRNKIIKAHSIEIECLLTGKSVNSVLSGRYSWLINKNNKPINKNDIYYIFADAGVAQKLPFYIRPFGSTSAIIVNNNKEIYKESMIIDDISDNNQVEMIAVITALMYLKDNLNTNQYNHAAIIIASDSQLVLDQILLKDSINNLINDFDKKTYNTRTKDVSFFEEGFKPILIKYKELIEYFHNKLYTVWCKGHEETNNNFLKDEETSFYVYYNDKCDTICSKLLYDKYKEYNCLDYMRENRQNTILKKFNDL